MLLIVLEDSIYVARTPRLQPCASVCARVISRSLLLLNRSTSGSRLTLLAAHCVHAPGTAGEECGCDISPRCAGARAEPGEECVAGQTLQRGPVSVANRSVWSADYRLQTRCLFLCPYVLRSVPRVAWLPNRLKILLSLYCHVSLRILQTRHNVLFRRICR